MALTWKDLTLTPSAIEEISAEIQKLLLKLGTERREMQRIRLTAEELLIRIREKLGDNAEVRAGIGRQYGKYVLNLRYGGEPFDPTVTNEDDWSVNILKTLGIAPAWSYRMKTNRVTLTLRDRKKPSSLAGILIAVAAAVILGFAGGAMPDAVTQAADTLLISPLMNAFLGLLNTFAGLMVGVTICSGILGVGDTASFGRLGKGVMLRFIVILFITAVFSLAGAAPLMGLDLSASSGGGEMQAAKISEMIFGILPHDPVGPFLQGNTLQIIVIAVIAGMGLLYLGERTANIHILVEEAALLFGRITSGVCAFIPVFVFCALVHQFWSGSIGTMLTLWKPVCVYTPLIIVWSAAMIIITAIKTKCPPGVLFKKILPPFAVAFSTASSMSVFGLSMDVCRKKLGINESLLKFGYPIGAVVFMPSAVIHLCVLACYFANEYAMEVSVPWLVMAAITSVLLSVAIPPIPGAMLIVYSVLFAQLGMPPEALVIAAALDILYDHLNTGFDILLLITELTRTAGATHNLDRDVLLQKD
ncbi:MAG: cation:dicarboxylase symporter family transporter [Clostridia bacterium]|nr:cation:dicarboxylase symporter family transporter [Clostridia bacterium]